LTIKASSYDLVFVHVPRFLQFYLSMVEAFDFNNSDNPSTSPMDWEPRPIRIS